MSPSALVDAADLEAVRSQLGRVPRGVAAVAHRCPCGLPDVLRTEPRLPDGTPFPTTYYVTCPRLTGAISTLETSGIPAPVVKPILLPRLLNYKHQHHRAKHLSRY